MLRGSYLEGEIRELQQGLRESLGSAAVEAEMEHAAWSAEQAEEYGHRLEAQINEICQENWSGFVQLLKRRESGEASVVRRVDKLECEAAAMSRAPVQESPTTSNSMPPPPGRVSLSVANGCAGKVVTLAVTPLDTLSITLLAKQLPSLPNYTGDHLDGDGERVLRSGWIDWSWWQVPAVWTTRQSS